MNAIKGYTPVYINTKTQDSTAMDVERLGVQTQMPYGSRNYCIFNQPLVNKLVQKREHAIPYIERKLQTTNNEKVVAEGLYTLDRMIDANVKGIEKTYPTISRFNNTQSPTLQVLLAGIYRKIQVPDAFGPLNKMLIQDSIHPPQANFDPTEEIGGAILEYLKNSGAQKAYNN